MSLARPAYPPEGILLLRLFCAGASHTIKATDLSGDYRDQYTLLVNPGVKHDRTPRRQARSAAATEWRSPGSVSL